MQSKYSITSNNITSLDSFKSTILDFEYSLMSDKPVFYYYL